MKETFLSHSDAAQLNRSNVLHYIRSKGPVSRTDIWESMNISRASVTQLIRQLLEAGLIIENGKSLSNGGRALKGLVLNVNARHLFAFDWNTQLICKVNIGGEILRSKHLAIPENCTPAVFARIVSTGLDEISEYEDAGSLNFGLALPGLIDARSQTVLYSVELDWHDVNMRRLFSGRFGDKIFLERTGNALALGEYVFGAARGINHFVLVLLGKKGIGASSVIHGNCQHGGNYMFGELGHIKTPADVICACGQAGCLEAVVSDILMKNDGKMDDKVMEYIAIGISTAVSMYDPVFLMLAGELVQDLNKAASEQLNNLIRSMITSERSRKLSIKISRPDNLMGIKGISANVFNQWFPIS